MSLTGLSALFQGFKVVDLIINIFSIIINKMVLSLQPNKTLLIINLTTQ